MRARHNIVSTVSPVIYIFSSIMFAVILPNSSLNLSADANDYPNLTASEMEVVSRIYSKAEVEVLSENDLKALKNVIEEYSNRTGTETKKSDIDFLTKTMKIMNEYYYELGQSLLLSWDGKSRITTRNYDKVLRLVKHNGMRKSEKLRMDSVCLDAAARNQNYVQNSAGDKFKFGRETILQKLRENEISRANYDKIIKILNASKPQ